MSSPRMKSVPVLDLGEEKIEDTITQSAVIHMLEECVDLRSFKSWRSKKLCELGLSLMNSNRVIKIGDQGFAYILDEALSTIWSGASNEQYIGLYLILCHFSVSFQF